MFRFLYSPLSNSLMPMSRCSVNTTTFDLSCSVRTITYQYMDIIQCIFAYKAGPFDLVMTNCNLSTLLLRLYKGLNMSYSKFRPIAVIYIIYVIMCMCPILCIYIFIWSYMFVSISSVELSVWTVEMRHFWSLTL